MIKELFKTEKIHKRALYLHPIASLIMWDMWLYCHNKNLEFVVTDTVTTLKEDMDTGRLSSTHRSSRAFDLRNRSWSLWEIKSFENHFNKKYKEYGAIDSQGNRRLIVSVKHGTGPHFHVQIDRIFSLENKNLD